MSDLTPCYVAQRECGCAVGFVANVPGMPVRKDINRWLKAGYAVKLMTVEDSRPLFRRCTHQRQLPLVTTPTETATQARMEVEG